MELASSHRESSLISRTLSSCPATYSSKVDECRLLPPNLIQESLLHIYLIYLPLVLGFQINYQADCFQTSNRCKYLIIINIGLLLVQLGYQYFIVPLCFSQIWNFSLSCKFVWIQWCFCLLEAWPIPLYQSSWFS